MEDSIVIFGSYNEGEEFEEKVAQVERLNREGINANLSYLLKLDRGRGLPKQYVDFLMIENIENSLRRFNPTVLAFHNGMTINYRKKEFIQTISHIKQYNPKIIYLMEHLDCPEKSYYFKEDPDFLEWCESNFEKEHVLYNTIWKPKI